MRTFTILVLLNLCSTLCYVAFFITMWFGLHIELVRASLPSIPLSPCVDFR